MSARLELQVQSAKEPEGLGFSFRGGQKKSLINKEETGFPEDCILEQVLFPPVSWLTGSSSVMRFKASRRTGHRICFLKSTSRKGDEESFKKSKDECTKLYASYSKHALTGGLMAFWFFSDS